ncbi:hypothetical protein KIPB_015728, partial [Kipferlia bialata]
RPQSSAATVRERDTDRPGTA